MGQQRAQVLNAVAQGLLQAHDDGHLDKQVHHAATEMALLQLPQASQARGFPRVTIDPAQNEGNVDERGEVGEELQDEKLDSELPLLL